MGQRDLAQSDYFSDPVRFADACNGILFNGREVVKAEELQEADADIVYRESDGKLRKTIPDKVRIWNGIYLSIITLENQTMVDYSMVFRTMKEEAVSYEKQWMKRELQRIREGVLGPDEKLCWAGKGERFIPVVTIVIYFGIDKPWDAATCLYDMLDIQKEMKPYVTNYRMNLYDFHDHEDFSVFKSENRELFEILSCADDKGKMKRLLMDNKERFDRLAQSVTETIFKIAGIKNKIIKLKLENEEVADVCKAWDDWRLEGVEEGMELGKELGLDMGRTEGIRNLMKNLKMTTAQAMDALGIPVDNREKYYQLLNQ